MSDFPPSPYKKHTPLISVTNETVENLWTFSPTVAELDWLF